MSLFRRFPSLPMLAIAAALGAAGCHQAPTNQSAANPSSTPQDQPSDPASANLAPVSDNSAVQPISSSSTSAAPASYPSQGSQDQGYDQDYDESQYGEQAAYTAPQPPPPLPEYDQPPAPGDDYLWTPGYWSWGSGGYYWVPGVWVQAPYQGALWTPGYWGYRHHRYEFFHGYWGPHIGFYGGVNYGFGYVGTGYQGGYWNSGRFYYNRDVNNVNANIVHNVYNRTVVGNSRDRVAFNGGSGGIQVRPRPAELAALREPHAPPMTAQIQIQHAASTNREQFVSVNHGRPASATINKPVVADRDVHPVAPPPMRNQPNARTAGPTPAAPGHPAMQQTAPNRPNVAEPNRPVAQQPAPSRPMTRQTEPPTPSRPVPEHQAPQRSTPPQATSARPGTEQHAAPARPAAQQPAPARINEARPAAPSRPAQHATEAPTPSHPLPERAAPEHAAPPKPAAAKPAPAKPAPAKPAAHPQQKPDEEHPH